MDGEKPEQPTMTPDMMKAFAEYMGAQFARMDESDAKATEFQEASRQKIHDSINDMLAQTLMKSGTKPSGPQYAPEVLAIANALTLQPILIPAVDRFLRVIVKKYNEVWQQVVEDTIRDHEGTEDAASN